VNWQNDGTPLDIAETESVHMMTEPRKEHHWLQKLVGEWTYEHECLDGTDKPAQKATGSEVVRSLGGLWVVCEGSGQMPGGGDATMIMTLGYDPAKNRYVGTWVGSMMANLWVYDGQLDASQKVLTLNCEGPSFSEEGKTARYRDVIEFKSDDVRTLTSHTQGPDGKWTQFMTATYRRKR
jgi:hypothetical protein